MSRDNFGEQVGQGVATFDAGDGRTVTPTSGEDVAARLAAGEQVVSDRVRVISTRTGRAGSIDAATLRDSLESGAFRLPTPEEALQARRGEIYTDRGLEAGVVGVANVLTLGAAGRNDTTTQGLREFNENAFAAGETIGSGVLGGVAGNALRGASLASRVIAGTVEGVVGAGAETASRLSDQRLEGDAALNAESILASLGGSIMLGGSLGAAFELGGAALGSVGRRVADSGRRRLVATREAAASLFERTTGREAAPGVAEAIRERWLTGATAGMGDDAVDFATRATARNAEGRTIREAISRGDGLIDDALRPMRQQIDSLAQTARRTAEEAGGSLKRDQIRGLVRAEALDIGEAASFSGAIRDMAERVRGDAGGSAFANRFVQMADQADDAIEAALANGTREGVADAFIAIDQLKRKYGREVSRAHRSGQAIRDSIPELDQVYEVGRQFLEREDLFGAAAVAQREINAAWSEHIAYSRQFRSKFLDRAGVQDGFDALWTADPKKLNSFLRETGTAVGELNDEVYEGFLRSQQRFNRAVADNYELDDALRDAYRQDDQILADMLQQREAIQGSLVARNQFAEFSQLAQQRAGVVEGGALTIAGSVAGGPLGAVLGMALGTVVRPDKTIQMLASVERMTQTFRGRLQSRSRDFVERIARPGGVERLARSGGGNRNAIRGAVVGMTAAEVADRFDRLTETIEKNGDTPAMVERLADRTVDLGDAAPQTATMLTAAVVRAQQYLQSQLPPLAYNVPAPLGAPSTRASQRVTEDEQRAMLRTAETIEDPLRVLEEAGRGMLTAEHTETLRVVYPSLHRELVTTVTETIADRDEPLPYSGRLTVSLLLGIPTDPSLSGEAIASAQAGHAGPQPTDPGGPAAPLLTPGNRRAPETVSIYQTTTQRIRS